MDRMTCKTCGDRAHCTDCTENDYNGIEGMVCWVPGSKKEACLPQKKEYYCRVCGAEFKSDSGLPFEDWLCEIHKSPVIV